MKIAQVTPGLMPIPPNGWGAVEKIIWAYSLELKKLGHEVDIIYCDDINKGDYDIVHVHISNLAMVLADRGIPYVFTMHDHHVEVFGKGSFAYEENLEAINRSMFSMVPSEHLIDYFGAPNNLKYLPHGVDSDFFTPPTLKEPVNHSLLCVGKNGYVDDPKFDRKGFGFALKAAVELSLPITIAGPSANSEFFEAIDTTYSKLEIKNDLTEDELKEEYKKHTIFLHPSIVEAGHPNLTLLEAMSAGLPIVGAYTGKEFELEGIRRTGRDVSQIVTGISEVIGNYKSFRSNAISNAKSLTWGKVVHRLDAYLCSEQQSQKFLNNHLSIYNKVLGGDFCKQRPSGDTRKLDTSRSRILQYSFVENPKVEMRHSHTEDDRFDCIFYVDGVPNFKTELSDNTWAALDMKRRSNIDIQILKKPSGDVVSSHKYNDKDQRVLIWFDSKSLGDSLAWMPQVERYRKISGAKVVLSTFWNNILENQYPKIEFVKPGIAIQDLYASFRIACVDDDASLHKVPWREVPLSKVCSDILGIPYKEENCKVNPSTKPRPIKEKYVCISTSSTSGCKQWHEWQGVVDHLNDEGYKVVVIQKEPLDYMDLKGLDNVIFPEDKDINKAINWLEYCEFFVGLSSGVSWLAHSLGKEVVMISGFTEPHNEFSCIRLINKSKCHGCWHKHKFDRGNWNWCPEHEGTERQFECMKNIKVEDVTQALPIKV